MDAFFFNQLHSHAVQHFMRAPLCRWVGSCACFRRRRFRLGSLVQVFFPSVPLVLFGVVGLRFFFFTLAISGFALSGPGVCVCVWWGLFLPSSFAASCSSAAWANFI